MGSFATQEDGIKAMQKALSGLTEEQAKLVLNNTKLDKSVIDSTLSMYKQEVATKATTTSQVSQIGIVDALKLKYNALATSIGLTTTQLTIALGVVGAIAAAVTVGVVLWDKYHVSLKEATKALNEAKDEYTEITSELKACNQELKTATTRMNELESMGSLSFVEEKEYEQLRKTNNELKRTVALLKQEQKIKNKEKNKAFVQTMKSDIQDNLEYSRDTHGNVVKGDAGLYNSTPYGETYMVATEQGYIKQQFERRSELLDSLYASENVEEQKRIQKQIDDIDIYLQGKSEEWRNHALDIDYISSPSSDDEKAVNEWLDFIGDFQDKMSILQTSSSPGEAEQNAEHKQNAFNRIVDNWKFDETVQELQVLGEQGKVTADMLMDSKYDEFIGKLVELGVIANSLTYEGKIEEIAKAFNKAQEEIAPPSKDENTLAIEDIDKQISLLESRKSQLDNFIKMTETAGYTVSKDMYDKLIAEEEKIQDGLVQQRDIWINKLESGLNNGTITEYDDSWYELMGQINEVTLAIEESGINLYEYQNIINELDWNNFDKLRDIMSDIIDESNFLIDLLSNEKLIDDVGDYTDAGLATLGQHSANREIYLNEADEYQKKIVELDKQYKDKQDNEHYIKQRREWVDAMRDSISAAEDEKQAMVDLARDGIKAQIDYTQELIDKKKELLDQEQELYNYQKSINEKTDNIANIKKQLSVYENDTSEEGRQRVQQLRNQLKEAEDDLEETQYDKWVQDQTDMLDTLMTEYEELQNKLSEDTERLFAETNSVVNANGDVINSTLTGIAEKFDYSMSEAMTSINNAFTGEGSIKTVFEDIETDFNNAVLEMQKMANTIGEVIKSGTKAPGTEHDDLIFNTSSSNSSSGSTQYVPIDPSLNKPFLKDFSEYAFGGIIGNSYYKTAVQEVQNAVEDGMKQIASKVTSPSFRPVAIDIGEINLPNVTDPKQFADGLVTNLKNNPAVQKTIQSFTIDLVGGKSFMEVYKH